jgi:hypothetical protein
MEACWGDLANPRSCALRIETILCCGAYVSFWPIADMTIALSDVCFWGQSRHDADASNAEKSGLLLVMFACRQPQAISANNLKGYDSSERVAALCV